MSTEDRVERVAWMFCAAAPPLFLGAVMLAMMFVHHVLCEFWDRGDA